MRDERFGFMQYGRKDFRRNWPALLVVVCLLATGPIVVTGCNSNSDASARSATADKESPGLLSRILPGPTPVKLASGTAISVRLLHSVSSRTANAGDPFEAEIAAPLIVDGKTLFPRGARVRGRVMSAKASGRLQDPGYLRLTLDSVQTSDGKWVDVDTSSISAKGQSHKKRNTTMIGGGAGLGALIGGIAGGGKGAAIGAGVGAGAGTAGAYASGKKDVTFSAESKLTFTLARDVTVKS